MVKKRSKVDPDLFASTEVEREPSSTTAPEEELARATYYLRPDLKDAITRRATDLGLPASQLAMFLLSEGLRRLDAGDVDPSPHLTRSDSPRFRHNLEIADWYYTGDE